MKKIDFISDISSSFKSKKFKQGSYATLSTIIIICIVVVLNLLIGKFNLKFDLTKNKLYTLSDQSKQILKSINKDVNIIALYKAGNEDKAVKQILDQYEKFSDKIKVQYKDPELYPEYVKKYEKEGNSITEGNIIVECGNKFKVLSSTDLVSYSQYSQLLTAEQNITGAITYVTSDKRIIIYNSQGHNEDEIPYNIKNLLENQNYEIKNVNLLTDNIDPNSGLLMIMGPKVDLSPEEVSKIKNFLEKGGHLFISAPIMKSEPVNLNKLISDYGVKLENALVIEGSSTNRLQNPLYIIPDNLDHSIISPISNSKFPIILKASHPISDVDIVRHTVKVEPLLKTSDKAYAKTNLQSEAIEKEKNDLSGPFVVACAITDEVGADNKNPKIVIISSSNFVDESLTANGLGNTDLLLNSINWLQDNTQNISVSPKDLSSNYLQLSGAKQLLFSGLVVIVIPIIILISGITVCIRRKNL